MKRITSLLALAAIAGAADAASFRFDLSVTNQHIKGTLNTADAANTGGNAMNYQATFQLGGGDLVGGVSGLGHSADGTLYASIRNTGAGTFDLRRVGAGSALGASVSDLVQHTISFDFADVGNGERFFGFRGASLIMSDAGGPFDAGGTFSSLGNHGLDIPSSGYDGSQYYYGITSGNSDANRSIYRFDLTDTGNEASGTFIANLDFQGVDYGGIALSGGDIENGIFFLSFQSAAVGGAVVGTVDLTTGAFTELLRMAGATGNQMGLNVVMIPLPSAGMAGLAGLAGVALVRRRRFD